jgi:hypothetical protein
MNIPKQKVKTVKVSVRFSEQVHAELKEAAETNGWTVNAEINHRVRMVTASAKIDALTQQITSLQSLIRQKQGD